MRLEIYTDGACSGNPGPGGWAAVLCLNDKIARHSGGCFETTNNRMELKAVIEGLKKSGISTVSSIYIFSDSSYVVNSMNEGYVKRWVERGWKTTKNEEVKNRDLWEELLRTVKQIKKLKKIRFVKVKGHADCQMNSLADKLAREAIPTP